MLAGHSRECLQWFGALLHGLEAMRASFDKESVPFSILRNELGRFCMWQANIADLQMSSYAVTSHVGCEGSIERVGSATLYCLDSLEDALSEGNLP